MIVTYFGWFCIAMLCLAGVILACALFAHCLEKVMQRWECHVTRKRDSELGRAIVSSAHWFSENAPVMVAIRILGESIRDGYRVDASSWRDRWHNTLRAEGKTGDAK